MNFFNLKRGKLFSFVLFLRLVIFTMATSAEKLEPLPSAKRVKTLPKNINSESFPDTLEDFGYKFEDGHLRHIETGEPFKFEVKDDPDYNQRHYEALGEVITHHVYKLLEEDVKLVKLKIPENSTSESSSTFIFHTKDAFVNEKLIVLIHGSGVVRAGQWSRKLIVNDGLDDGTQIPFIKRAIHLGYAVIVLNTNDHDRGNTQFLENTMGRTLAQKHGCYIWESVVSKCKAKHIAIIAHSYGGVVTVHVCNYFFEMSQKKIFAIALTDSVHDLMAQKVTSEFISWLKKVARNWVSSSRPLDKPIRRAFQDADCVSAGTTIHEKTSWLSFESIFEFVEQKYLELASSEREEL